MKTSFSHIPRFVSLFFLLLFGVQTPVLDAASLVGVSQVRHSNSKARTRVVIDLDGRAQYSVSRQSKARTLRIQLKKAQLRADFLSPNGAGLGPLLRKIEVRSKGLDGVEVLIHTKQLGAHKLLRLENPHRLVIDLFPPTAEPSPFQIKTIVIDPGHGGKDPGARSRRGLQEKNVALDLSKRLKVLIEKRLKMKVILTRDKDVFISLKKRTQIANRAHADLFVSVHINSSRSRKLKGIEVYLLGRASDKRALALAARENAGKHKTALDLQKMILNDLKRDFTRNASLELAHFTSDSLNRNLISKYPTNLLGVKRAPFYVLNHTTMPAILAEISFISNRTEEKRLRSKLYRQKAAEALFKGIKAYIASQKGR